jgi:hypothetical protein
MYRLTYLLTLSDPHLLIERKLIAHLVVTALLRCGVGMWSKTCSLCAGLPVRTGEPLELCLLVAELALVLLHLFVIVSLVNDHTVAILNHTKILLLNAVEDLLLLSWGGSHVVGEVSVEVITYCVWGLNCSIPFVWCLKQVLLG